MSLQMRQNLSLRMEQKLKLTPQMIQSIEILLLPQMALEERIMNEIESNPALEITESVETAGGLGVAAEAATDRFHDNDLDWFRSRRAASREEDGPDKMGALAATPERTPSLADHLIEQLRFVELTAEERECAVEICWHLDRRGYLVEPLNELFPEERLEAAEHAWEKVRACDPAGVGARDLADCLLLQLTREPGDNSFEMTLIREHLIDLLKNRLPAISLATGHAVERLQDVVEVISRLDPRPGLPYARDDNSIVVPDVVVERDVHGEWIVSVPDGRVPKIQVSDSYWQLYDQGMADAKDKAYLKDKLIGAKFLIDAVNQRKRTLLKIVSEIIKHQTAFLEGGVEQLRPLMRQNIADIIGMHVATVSRAVKDKYIQTPSGILRLAEFFSGGIANQDGSEAESSKSVKMRIQKLIETEDKRNPLSDQEIADLLDKEGLEISRRTVTKYRIADGVPSTRQRRVF